MSLSNLLTNPDAFYEQIGDDPSLLPPVMIVLVTAILGAAASYPMFQQVQSALPAEASGISTFIMVSAVIGGLLGPFLAWLILTGVFHAISALVFDGSGSFSGNLAMVGWGYVPGIIGSVFTAVGNFYLYRDVTFPSDPQAIQPFINDLKSQPEFMAISLVGIIILLWQAFIWAYAEKHARNLELRDAAITVGAPVALFVAWQLYQLV